MSGGQRPSSRSSFAEFRKKQREAAAKGAQEVRLRRARDEKTRTFPLSLAGTVDTAEVGAAFGLHDVWFSTPSGGVVVSFEPGAEYIVDGISDVCAALGPSGPRRVGFASPEAVLGHVPPDRIRQHPEQPARITHTLERLAKSRVLECVVPLLPAAVDEGHVRMVHTAAVARGALEGFDVHTDHGAIDGYPGLLYRPPPPCVPYPTTLYLPVVSSPRSRHPPPPLPSDTYASPESTKAVAAAVGAVLSATESVYTGHLESAFCLVRPPGHHCTAAQPQGFCLVNNVAIATRHLQSAHPTARVAIVDFDVHHGDGTQNIFDDDPSVLFISLHRYDGGRFFPHTGHPTSTGSGRGQGTSFNIGFDTDTGRDGMVINDAAFEESAKLLILPLLRKWAPDLVIVSAGYDAAEGDPLGRMKVVDGFARLTHHLVGLGKVVMVLEGGYNLHSLACGVESTLRVLLGAPPPPPPSMTDTERKWIHFTLRRVIEAHLDLHGPLHDVLEDAARSLSDQTPSGC
eukprot:Sspe_Gene.39413::Locus_19008_Transcript_1_1_Confidence_1.000_Length_1615::g.39413::m.39413/K11407/HDAC6; histone deacetylase 6